jgi:hypothetical protein
LALIWIFKIDADGNPQVPQNLILPAFFIVIALSSDLLQYLSGTIAWGTFNRIKELGGADNVAEFKAPRYINWATQFFFVMKMLTIIVGYYLLTKFLVHRFVV